MGTPVTRPASTGFWWNSRWNKHEALSRFIHEHSHSSFSASQRMDLPWDPFRPDARSNRWPERRVSNSGGIPSPRHAVHPGILSPVLGKVGQRSAPYNGCPLLGPGIFIHRFSNRGFGGRKKRWCVDRAKSSRGIPAQDAWSIAARLLRSNWHATNRPPP